MNKNYFNPAYTGPRDDIVSLIPPNCHKILDVGCSNGALGYNLKQHIVKAHVTGIEFDQGMAKEAKKILDKVIISDLDTFNFKQLKNNHYDCIIFADVLEHLKDPWTVFQEFTKKLKPGGYTILSLPNSSYYLSLWYLVIKNKWAFNDSGIYDRTHLHLFALENMLDLLRQNKLNINFIQRKLRLNETQSLGPIAEYIVIHSPFRRFFVRQYLLLGQKTYPLNKNIEVTRV